MNWTDEIVTKVKARATVGKWITASVNSSINEINDAFKEGKMGGYEAQRDPREHVIVINRRRTCNFTTDMMTETTSKSINDITEEDIKDIVRKEILDIL